MVGTYVYVFAPVDSWNDVMFPYEYKYFQNLLQTIKRLVICKFIELTLDLDFL
jgi:hypothetical protein